MLKEESDAKDLPAFEGQGYTFDVSDDTMTNHRQQYHLSQTTGRPLQGFNHFSGNGIWNQDIDCESSHVLVPPPNVLLAQKKNMGATQGLLGKKRIPGLSQEYTVRQSRHPPEEFPFKP